MIILYIPLASKNANSSHKPVFFVEITTLFLLSLLLCGSRFLKRKTLKDIISGTDLFTNFQSGQNNGVKLWVFGEYSRTLLYKVTPDTNFTDEVVVQCDVPNVKVVLAIYKWSQIDFSVNTYGWFMYCFWTQFYSFSLFRNWSIYIVLGADYMKKNSLLIFEVIFEFK